jgi:hypothetical protein
MTAKKSTVVLDVELLLTVLSLHEKCIGDSLLR